MTKANELLDALKEQMKTWPNHKWNFYRVQALLAVLEEAEEALESFRLKVYNSAKLQGMDDMWATLACEKADTALATINKAKEICHE